MNAPDNTRTILAPSLLAADFAYLAEHVRAVADASAEYLHLDVMDGLFVPNISFGVPVIQSLRAVSGMFFDAHLMIQAPERYLEAFAEAGADSINVHVEACADAASVLRQIKTLGKKAAVAVKPATPLSAVYDLLELADMVLIMSVEPGFGGQKLIRETLAKARVLRDHVEREKLPVHIQMDGGIALDNLHEVLDAGVNVVVAGSAVFGKTPDASRERARAFCQSMHNR